MAATLERPIDVEESEAFLIAEPVEPGLHAQNIALPLVMQPLIVAKTLMQVGYEPVEPVHGLSLFLRRPAYYYPNVFQYMNHIRKEKGFTILYTGVVPKLLNMVSSTIVENKTEKMVRELVPLTGEDAKLPLEKKGPTGASYEVLVGCVAKTAGVIVSQPLHVIMVRMICSVVSNDQPYQGFFSTIKEIYETEGIAGFFSGLVPRWLGEMICITGGGVAMFAINSVLNSFEADDSARKNVNYSALVQFGLTSAVYKYNLTSVLTAATTPGLHLGLPYGHDDTWRSILSDLTKTKQLTRGSSYFFRKANI